MKKYIIILLAATLALFTSCQNKWQLSTDLGVNSTRINLSTAEGEFTVTGCSNTSWTALVTRGADWLKLTETSGSGIQTIHLRNDQNTEDPARIATLVLTANTGTVVEVNIVQSGTQERATDVPDNLL